MIPLRLELRGFTCFRGATVVDFEALEVDLFAIAGPTGAGKSTLLDGLTYALYGETARLGGRAAYLMSPGANEMTAQVVFRSGSDTYRVTRFAVRTKGSIQSQVRLERLAEDGSWVQLPESEKVREANPKVASLVGLDFDGFTRAVLLPQGEFHEFLRGDAAKRRRLLSRLMGLDTVEKMQKIAGEMARESSAEIRAVTTRLEEDYSGATPDRLNSLRGESSRLRNNVQELTERQGKLAAELRELHALKVIWEERGRLEGILSRLAKQEPEMAIASDRCERALGARLLIPHVQALGELKQRLCGTELEREKAQVGFGETEAALARATKDKRESEEANAFEKPEIEKALLAIAEGGPLAERLIARGGTLDMAENGAEEYQESDWEAFQHLEARAEEVLRLGQDLDDRERKAMAARETIVGLELGISKKEAERDQLQQRGLKAREWAKETDSELSAAEKANRATSLRAQLKSGDPCPVCGQPVRQVPANEEYDLGELNASRDEAAAKVDSLLEAYRGVQATLDIDRARHAERCYGLKDLEADINDGQRIFDSLSHTFSDANIPVDKDLSVKLRNRRKTLLSSLAQWVYQRTGGEDLEMARSRQITRRDELESALSYATETLATTNRELERNRTTLGMIDRRCSELTQELSVVEERNRTLFHEAGFSSGEEALSTVLSDEELSEVKTVLESYQREKDTTRLLLKEVEEQRAGRDFKAGLYEEKNEVASCVTSALAESQNALGRTERELQDLEERFLKAKDLRQRLRKAQDRFDINRTLNLDLRGDRFQEFLMTRIQSRLAQRASHIVRTVTDDRYDLQLIDGEFFVADAWNPGEARSARTLSGGETFIASLALALALSDTLAGNKTLGALFLDEGFGTLDKLTLDAVISVLENLTREGRMVGVITHVEALTERMPARLWVDKGREGSSVRWDL
jgi:exonuclease SbcC